MKKSESKYFNTAVKMNTALISLLEKKEFAYITVSEICRVAGVNRSTFYLHYETMGDLLEETTRYLLEDFRACFPIDEQAISMRFQDEELSKLNFITDEYLHPYLRYMRDHRRVFVITLSNAAQFEVEKIYQRLYKYVFDPILERFHYSEAYRPYVMRFYLNGVNAIVTEWLKTDCRLSVEEISAVIRQCIFGQDETLIAQINNTKNERKDLGNGYRRVF